MTPPIGVPRIYGPGDPARIYPGERAQARLDPAAVRVALETGRAIQLAGWLVEPAPGLYAWYLRARYRVWGQWFATGPPRLEAGIDVRPGVEDHP